MEQDTYLRAEAEVEKALMLKRNSVDERRPSYILRALEDLEEIEEGQEEADDHPVITIDSCSDVDIKGKETPEYHTNKHDQPNDHETEPFPNKYENRTNERDDDTTAQEYAMERHTTNESMDGKLTHEKLTNDHEDGAIKLQHPANKLEDRTINHAYQSHDLEEGTITPHQMNEAKDAMHHHCSPDAVQSTITQCHVKHDDSAIMQEKLLYGHEISMISREKPEETTIDTGQLAREFHIKEEESNGEESSNVSKEHSKGKYTNNDINIPSQDCKEEQYNISENEIRTDVTKLDSRETTPITQKEYTNEEQCWTENHATKSLKESDGNENKINENLELSTTEIVNNN